MTKRETIADSLRTTAARLHESAQAAARLQQRAETSEQNRRSAIVAFMNDLNEKIKSDLEMHALVGMIVDIAGTHQGSPFDADGILISPQRSLFPLLLLTKDGLMVGQSDTGTIENNNFRRGECIVNPTTEADWKKAGVLDEDDMGRKFTPDSLEEFFVRTITEIRKPQS